MNICQKIKKKKLPDVPGVYRFLDARGHVLYIGKATSLKDRVWSYCAKDIAAARGPVIVEMLGKARDVSIEKTDSVLEALVLEAALIKKHQPKYNSKEKSDKSFNYVVITEEDFPRIVLKREKELLRGVTPKYVIRYIFGPFPNGGQLREALKIVRKIFPFRDNTCGLRQGKPCFNRQIGLCPGICTGEITKKEYAYTIRAIKLFFEGKKQTLLQTLEKSMKQAARNKEFEKAGALKKTIFALGHINDVALIKQSVLVSSRRVEAYDVAHMAGIGMVGVMAVVSNGEPHKNEYRKFNIKSFEGINDTKALSEILSRRLSHDEWPLPQIVVVDGGRAQVNAAERVLAQAHMTIPVVGLVKDERHRPKRFEGSRVYARRYENDIVLANAEAHRFAIAFHRRKRRL